MNFSYLFLTYYTPLVISSQVWHHNIITALLCGMWWLCRVNIDCYFTVCFNKKILNRKEKLSSFSMNTPSSTMNVLRSVNGQEEGCICLNVEKKTQYFVAFFEFNCHPSSKQLYNYYWFVIKQTFFSKIRKKYWSPANNLKVGNAELWKNCSNKKELYTNWLRQDKRNNWKTMPLTIDHVNHVG